MWCLVDSGLVDVNSKKRKKQSTLFDLVKKPVSPKKKAFKPDEASQDLIPDSYVGTDE